MILQKILDAKKKSLEQIKKNHPFNELYSSVEEKINDRRDFQKAINQKNRTNIIAEFKRASPSKGKILNNGNPVKIAKIYESSGATALSVLTEEDFFCGNAEDLIKARNSTQLPVLRKDFIIDEYQIFETASLPADALLLIVRILDNIQLRDFYQLAKEYKINVLVEVHSEQELEVALKLEPTIIGINNRDLDTLKTDINTTKKLIKYVPDSVTIVAESGFSSRAEIQELQEYGVNAFLIGESLLTAGDIGEKLGELSGEIKH
jgi:indole-3-glycerol phosphate synthase